MKLLCDVCCAAPASVICCADQAALCVPCDSQIHGANKLSGLHPRLALLHHPDDQLLPLCDICQDSVGYFFCLEDRALLCRVCDSSIHSANSLASRHKRFLMTGIRVAPQPSDTSERDEPAHSPSQKSSPRNTRVNQSSHPSSKLNSKDLKISPQNVQNSPPRMGKSSNTRENITGRSSSVSARQKPRPPPLLKHALPNGEGSSKRSSKQMVENIEEDSLRHMGFPNVDKRIETQGNRTICKKLKESLRSHENLVSHNNAKRSLKPAKNHPVLNNAEESTQPERKHVGHKHVKETSKPDQGCILLEHDEGSIKPYEKQVVPNCVDGCFGISMVLTSAPSKSMRLFDAVESSPIPAEFQQEAQEIGHNNSKVVGWQRSSNDMLAIGEAIAAQTESNDCSITRKESISDYLSETIPGWKVDEIFSLYNDADTLHNFVNCGSRRPDALNSPDSDLFSIDNSNACFIDQQLVLDRAEAQVPSMASPPTLSGIPRAVKCWGVGRSRKQLDVGFLSGCDDTLVVPDIGGVSSPEGSPPRKRRRAYMDF